jgi:hypothetical protein
MKITKQYLRKLEACKDGIEWFDEQKTTDAFEIFDLLKEEEKYKWLSWILTKMMTKEECIKYAICAAENVLHIFEEKYPNNKRPREVINAAKKYLKCPIKKSATAAAYVAYANAAVAYVAYAAVADAAYAAAAAYATYAAATYAAAADAAYAAYDAAAYAATKELQKKICNYGIKLLKRRE